MRIRNLVDVGLSQGSIEDVHLSWWKSVSTCLRLAPTRGEAEDEEVFGSTGAFPGVVAASRHINCVRRGFDVEVSMLIERSKCQRQLISSVWTATERCR